MTLQLALSFINIIPALWCSGQGGVRAFCNAIGGDQREQIAAPSWPQTEGQSGIL